VSRGGVDVLQARVLRPPADADDGDDLPGFGGGSSRMRDTLLDAEVLRTSRDNTTSRISRYFFEGQTL
jgi:hypothetical protein